MNVRILTVILGCPLLASCESEAPNFQTYSGPERPSQKVAILYTASPAKVWVVDGRFYDRDTDAVGANYILLPGYHTVKVHYYQSRVNSGAIQSKNSIELKFYAKAGHAYKVQAQVSKDFIMWGALASDRTWNAKIVDITGQNPD